MRNSTPKAPQTGSQEQALAEEALMTYWQIDGSLMEWTTQSFPRIFLSQAMLKVMLRPMGAPEMGYVPH